MTGGHAVVTGGAGFIGSWLCERLLADDWSVWCVDSLITGARENLIGLSDHPRLRFVEADVADGLDVPGPVDLVMHLACPASPVHYLRHPLATLRAGSAGTTHALDLAERTEARFVLASTSEVYGDPLVHPQREDYWGNVNPIGPRSVYDEAKRFSEALTSAYRRARGVDTAIARIFNTYGPRMALDDGRVVPTFAAQALRGEPLTVAGDGSQTRSLCFVEDTVAGLLALAASGSAGPINIGGDDELTVLALAGLVLELSDSFSTITHVDLPVDDPKIRRPDLTRARGELGWAPRTPAWVGLNRTLQWTADRLGIPYEPAGARA
jgi:dTDP-glucose 4,6-dehydratase